MTDVSLPWDAYTPVATGSSFRPEKPAFRPLPRSFFWCRTRCRPVKRHESQRGDQYGGHTPRIECPRRRTRFQEHTPPGTAAHLHLLKFAFLLARLCSRFSFAPRRRTQTKRNICQLQNPVAFRGLSPAKLPIALEHWPFKTGRRSNPQFVLVISVLAVLRPLAMLGYPLHLKLTLLRCKLICQS